MNRNGTSITANTASEPPTTYAAQRLRAANPASGISKSAAIATAPARVNTSAARLYEVSEWTTSWLPYCSSARCSSSASGDTERVSFDDRAEPEHEERGRNDERAERQPARADISPFPQRAHDEEADERNPEEDRVGRMDDREHEPRRRGRGESPSVSRRTDSRASARAAGTRSWRDDVAGSERNT